MTAQNGDLVILKIGNAGTPETFTVIGGLRGTEMAFSSRPVDATNKASGQWQELLEGAGQRSLRIHASGMFTDSATEAQVRMLAMTNSLRNYQVSFGNGDVLQGTFKITSYNRSGGFRSEETYDLTLESSGEVTYATA